MSIFHSDFKLMPYWWEAFEPAPLAELVLPKVIPVAILGAGYAGLNAAIELTRNGVEVLVLDRAAPGFGASTRNGGMVSGGVNVGKRYFSKAMTDAEATPFLNDAAIAFSHVENLIAAEKFECGWQKQGYFLGAWSRAHYNGLAHKADLLNAEAQSGCYVVPREAQRAEIGSDYYHGGMVVERAAHLHPALYFKGLLDLALRLGVKIASSTEVLSLTQNVDETWQLKTSRGDLRARDVVIATNGYTGAATPQFQKRLVPIGSYIIATEELPPDLAASLSPKNRSIADTRRVLTYYRLSPDGRRMIFGGRAKFGFSDPRETAPLLYRFMLDRFPQLAGTKITHSWTGNVAFALDEMPHMGKLNGMHYALACNGSGIAMLSYLGHQTARKILQKSNPVCAFDRDAFPTHPLYKGRPWFLPALGAYFRSRDWMDRKLNRF